MSESDSTANESVAEPNAVDQSAVALDNPAREPAEELVPEVPEIPEAVTSPSRSLANAVPASSSSTVASASSRRVAVYLAPDKTPEPVNDYDESIYEMTTVRAKAYQSLLTTKSRKLTEGGPMLTKELRQKQEVEKRAKVGKIVQQCEVRIRFPDQTQLLSTFNTTETIGDVMTFVRFSLVDPMIPFYFFITPPRRVLADPSKTLVDDLGFGSREILYFAWDMAKLKAQLGEGYEPPKQPLRPEVLNEALDVSKMPTFESEQKEHEDEDTKKVKSKTLGGTGEAGRTLGGGPVSSGSKLTKPPAWMKLGRK
ncbi:hypothetical protein V1520DRAFT_335543 [Lipomyces starkeyi]|uniref:UBX domain-containing protein n=1 Tax=Lipomyces starkeyi NRRL Y-11557 TaxID=675824 RepID=A0A1E3PV15_LIPST|nr:hypothetical protein LIPSTDRAFT_195130 [Lipomyces starkeyi NRRL Y-11557]